MLNCQEVLRELESYFDDATAAEVRKELESHLGRCSHCRVVMDSTRHVLQIIAGCNTFELNQSLSDRVMANVRAQKSGV